MKKTLSLAFVALVSLAEVACSTTPPGTEVAASQRQSIDAGVDAALSRLYADTPGTRDVVAKAKGVLVIPRLVSAGLVVGGSHGEGALRVDGRTSGYYSAGGAALGVIAGADTKDMFLVFMSDEALTKFRTSSGWTAGLDGAVAFAHSGAGGRLDNESGQHQVIGYVLSNGGLVANVSIEGTKLTRLAI
jgi:lipid-binding SYLF domain-containing protein